VWHKVGWKFQPNNSIDWTTGSACQVKKPAGQHVVQHALGGTPFKRDRYDLRIVTCLAQRMEQACGESFRAPANKRYLYGNY